jgi:hypothetical protein
MTAEEIVNEIKALPVAELKDLVRRVGELGADEIPKDFVAALEDFENGRFVPMETALHEDPPTT